MLLAGDAINASCFAFGMLFFHMNFQSFLVFVVPVTFWTFESLTRVPRNIPSITSSHPGGAEDEVTFNAFNPSGTAVDVIGTGSDGGSL